MLCSGPSATRPPRRRVLVTGLALTALAALVAAPGPSTPAALAGGPVNPLTRHVSALQVGPGHEFRLLVVHPLHAPGTFAGPEDVRLGHGALPDTLGFRAPSRGGATSLRLDNLVEERLLVFPGQIMRSDRFDLAFTEHVVAKGRSTVRSPLAYVSTPSARNEPRPERRLLPEWLPPTLRFAVGPDAPRQDLDQTLSDWADQAELEGSRVSMADLARSDVLKERVADYERALGTLSRAPAGLQTVGYAAVLDGEPLVVETFADGATFAAVWPALIRALAVEAAYVESREELLETDMEPTGEPDRFLGAVRELLLTFYRNEPDTRSARETGTLLEVGTPLGKLHGLLLDRDAFVHAVLVTDPRRRSESEEQEFNPGVISRKARPTQAEQRWLDRRKKRNPPIPGSGDGPGPRPVPGPEPPEIPPTPPGR